MSLRLLGDVLHVQSTTPTGLATRSVYRVQRLLRFACRRIATVRLSSGSALT